MKKPRSDRRLSDEQIQQAVALYSGTSVSIRELGQQFGVSHSTMLRYVRQHAPLRGRGAAGENVTATHIRCSICREWKPRTAEHYYRNSSAAGFSTRCRVCDRFHARGRRYGIDRQQYDQLLQQQKGVCACCGCSPADGGDRWHPDLVVDHCHRTAVIRGLLCNRCNRLLGQAQDDPQVLRAAAQYLEAHAS